MALICIHGTHECDGCGECRETPVAFNCSICGGEIYVGENYFDIKELKVCEDCMFIARKEAE